MKERKEGEPTSRKAFVFVGLLTQRDLSMFNEDKIDILGKNTLNC